MSNFIIPDSNEPIQTIILSMDVGDVPLQARIEIRYLRGIDCWELSVSDDSDGTLLVNRIPLRASCGALVDLFRPFHHLRQGRGLGSFYCIPSSGSVRGDPAEENLTNYILLWCDEEEEH